MERLKVKDILMPGFTSLDARVIDLDKDQELEALFNETAKRQAELQARMKWTQEDYDAMRRVITI